MVEGKVNITSDEIFIAVGRYVGKKYGVQPTNVEITTILGTLKYATVSYYLLPKEEE